VHAASLPLDQEKNIAKALSYVAVDNRHTLVKRPDVGDVNIAKLQFRQQIGIEDQGVRLMLVAIMQEIEEPGLNSSQ